MVTPDFYELLLNIRQFETNLRLENSAAFAD